MNYKDYFINEVQKLKTFGKTKKEKETNNLIKTEMYNFYNEQSEDKYNNLGEKILNYNFKNEFINRCYNYKELQEIENYIKKNLLYISVHKYAPELNEAYFKNNIVLKVPQISDITMLKNYIKNLGIFSMDKKALN